MLEEVEQERESRVPHRGGTSGVEADALHGLSPFPGLHATVSYFAKTGDLAGGRGLRTCGLGLRHVRGIG